MGFKLGKDKDPVLIVKIRPEWKKIDGKVLIKTGGSGGATGNTVDIGGEEYQLRTAMDESVMDERTNLDFDDEKEEQQQQKQQEEERKAAAAAAAEAEAEQARKKKADEEEKARQKQQQEEEAQQRK